MSSRESVCVCVLMAECEREQANEKLCGFAASSGEEPSKCIVLCVVDEFIQNRHRPISLSLSLRLSLSLSSLFLLLSQLTRTEQIRTIKIQREKKTNNKKSTATDEVRPSHQEMVKR